MAAELELLIVESTDVPMPVVEVGNAQPQPQTMIGRNVHNYTVQEKIGDGRTASVYLAEHPGTHRRIAVKVLHPELTALPEAVARFFNEAKAGCAIQNENVVEIYDFDTLDDGACYVTMEYLNGPHLGTLLAGGKRIPRKEALQIARQVGRALAVAHEQGVLHLDLRPEKIYLVTRGDSKQVVKLADLGLARLGAPTVTGVPHHQSPEQCCGVQTEIDQRADVYALGVVLYEMLSGRLPFEADSVGELLLGHMTRTPERLRAIDATIPAPVEEAVFRALEKDPGKRFEKIAEFVKALEERVDGDDTTPFAFEPLDEEDDAKVELSELVSVAPRAATPEVVVPSVVTPTIESAAPVIDATVQTATAAAPAPISAAAQATSVAPVVVAPAAAPAPVAVVAKAAPAIVNASVNSSVLAKPSAAAPLRPVVRPAATKSRTGLVLGLVGGGLACLGALFAIAWFVVLPSRAKIEVTRPIVPAVTAPVPAPAAPTTVVNPPAAPVPAVVLSAPIVVKPSAPHPHHAHVRAAAPHAGSGNSDEQLITDYPQ
jgi:serine/threonine-protein kinase